MTAAAAPACQPPDPDPRVPRTALPRGACDCHAHVFGPMARFPFAADRHYTPPESTLAAYLRMLDRIGCDRGVLVQPGVYGHGNDNLLDALARARGRLRGVVGLDLATTSDETLAELRAQGVRGLRVDMRKDPDLPVIASRVAPFGWHLDALVTVPTQVTAVARQLDRLAVPLVVEGMGMLAGGLAPTDHRFAALVDLACSGSVWVKLSHAYKVAPSGPPYQAFAPLARILVEAAPHRLLWGTDWPHPNVTGPMPNDGLLAELAAEWITDPAARQQVLVDNPALLYGFGDPAPSAHAD